MRRDRLASASGAALSGPARAVLALFFFWLGFSACKPSRSPREAAAEPSIEGVWHAESVTAHPAAPDEELLWRIALVESSGGRLSGEGNRSGTNGEFPIRGLRDERTLRLRFDVEGEGAEFEGSILDARTLVGELRAGQDTLPLTFRR